MSDVRTSSFLICMPVVLSLILSLPGSEAAAVADSPAPFNVSGPQLPFIRNDGQLSREVAFYTSTSSGNVYVTKDGGIVYAIEGEQDYVIRESFLASRQSAVAGLLRADTLVNYYSGSDPAGWHEAVSTFQSLDLGRKYELIDVQLAVVKDTVEKIFTVHPGGDVANIRSRFKNAKSLLIDGSGRLLVHSHHGTIQFTEPVAYQIKYGMRIEVDVSYQIDGHDYGFIVGDFDNTRPLIIDPLLASTYIGGKSNETTYAMEAYGSEILLAGTADSEDFPGLEGKIGALGDAFVVRLDPDLSTIRAATYFGGSMTEGVRAIAAGKGAIYAAGFNNSPDFPTTPGAAYSGTNLSGAFVVRMDPDTLRITSSTSFHANVFGLAWSEAEGEVYVAGSTGDTGIHIFSDNFPAFQQTHKGSADSFVVALDEDLTKIKRATLLGGEGFDIIYDLTVDGRGYPVAVGITNSAAFPVSENAFGPSYNLDWEANHQWIDGFVAKFTPDLSDLEAATYLGGGLIDNITTVAAEGSLVLVGGNTASADFPCGSTFGPVDGNDAFVVLFNEDLSRIKSCTVFGGSRPGTDSPESVHDVAFHPSGSVFAVGRTNASDFPTTPGAFHSRPSGSYYGAFIISFNRDMSVVEASTLIHGNSEDLKAVDFDSWGDVIVAGDSTGSRYPVTPGVLQPEHMGGDDLVVSRFTSDLSGPHIELLPGALDFGPLAVGTEKREEIILYNTGGSVLTITDIQVSPDPSSVFRVENPCYSVPAFGSCTMEIAFKPATTRPEKGTLVIFSNDHFRDQMTIDLKGRGITASADDTMEEPGTAPGGYFSPRIEVTPDPCEFGKVNIGSALSKTLMVTNSGTGDLHLKKILLEPEEGQSFAVVRETCTGTVLEPHRGSSDGFSFCVIQIIFKPETIGETISRLTLHTNDPDEPAYAVELGGSGIDPEEPLSPGFWGWVAILVLILRMVLGVPVSARGWGRWMKQQGQRKR